MEEPNVPDAALDADRDALKSKKRDPELLWPGAEFVEARPLASGGREARPAGHEATSHWGRCARSRFAIGGFATTHHKRRVVLIAYAGRGGEARVHGTGTLASPLAKRKTVAANYQHGAPPLQGNETPRRGQILPTGRILKPRPRLGCS